MNLRTLRIHPISQPLHTTMALLHSIMHRQNINNEIKKLRGHRMTHSEENMCRTLYASSEPRFWRALTRELSCIVITERGGERHETKKTSIDQFKQHLDSTYRYCCTKSIDSAFYYAGV